MDLGLFAEGFGKLLFLVGAVLPLAALFMRDDTDEQED